jgi:hypothetical protein
MSLVVSKESKELMLSLILNKKAADGNPTNSNGDRTLKLFVNNIVPSQSILLGDLEECTATGYASITLQGSSWSVNTVSGETSASYAEQVFTIEDAISVYGYYVTNKNGTELLWVERFLSAPYVLPPGGGAIGVTLNFKLN